MVAIIDYDAGNIKSVEKAFEYLGADTVITRDPKEIYRADEKELRMFDFLTEKELSRLIDKDWEYSDNTINECIKNDIDIIPLCSDSYPGRLKEIAAPPVVLFKKGILPDEKAFHANIVGTTMQTHLTGCAWNG